MNPDLRAGEPSSALAVGSWPSWMKPLVKVYFSVLARFAVALQLKGFTSESPFLLSAVDRHVWAVSSRLCSLPHYSFRFRSTAFSGRNLNKSWMQDMFLVGNNSALPYMSSCVSWRGDVRVAHFEKFIPVKIKSSPNRHSEQKQNSN